MKFAHLSDLHIGKRVNGFSMLEDQAFVLKEILTILKEEKPDAVLIAGDVYDKTVPGAEAVSLFDGFITALSGVSKEIFIISGNHDSSERLAFGRQLMDPQGVHFSPVYEGSVKPFVLRDEFGEAYVYMLPFVKPQEIRRFFPETEILSYTDAVRACTSEMQPDPSRRNVLLSHQFVTGAFRSESEEVSVGGIDNVDASVYAPFDYVALGHIHGPQEIKGREGQILRYSGTPLKYSFSEKEQQKSVSIITLGEKKEGRADISVKTVPLHFLHDMRTVRGSYEELMLRKNYEGTKTDDYLEVILTDEEDIPDVLNRLRLVYPNIMKLSYDNTRTRSSIDPDAAADPEETDPLKLFEAFYQEQNGKEMSEAQAELIREMILRVFGEES